jgi:ABC-2 type transport system permease protein
MFWAVLRMEWLVARRERSFWSVLGVFGMCIAFAAFSSHQLVRSERAHLAASAAGTELGFLKFSQAARAIESGARIRHAENPTDPYLVGKDLLPHAVSLPLAPWASLANGQRDLLPQTILLTTQSRQVQTSDVGAAQRATGPFDLAFVIGFLLPLLVALVLSQPIALSTFVFGKAALRALLLMGLSIGLSALGAVLAGADLGAPGGLCALVLFVGLVVIYTLFWFALSLAVNAWGRGSSANALALVGFWLAFVVVVPGLASVAVDTLHPSPSRVELVNQSREAASQASSEASEIEGDHGKPAGDRATTQRAISVQIDLDRRLLPVRKEFQSRVAAQHALVDWLRFASPVLLLGEGLTDVAGSGTLRYQHFSNQVDAFHERHKSYFNDRVRGGNKLSSSDYDTMPRFSFKELPFSALSVRVLSAVVALLLMCGLLLGVSLIGLRKHFGLGGR